MKLYCWQHGDAVPEEVDPERPLSARGREDVTRIAEFVGRAGIRAARVLHSGRTRARQTADIAAGAMAAGLAPEAISGMSPNDPPQPIAQQIANWAEDTLLVSHMPFLGRLVACLLAADPSTLVAAFQPGTLACLERDAAGRWAIAWILRPELFRA